MKRQPSKKDIQRRRESRKRNRQKRRRLRAQQQLPEPESVYFTDPDSDSGEGSDSEYFSADELPEVEHEGQLLPIEYEPYETQEDEQPLRWDTNSDEVCIVCLERAGHQGMGELLNPCKCPGEMANYHYKCLCDNIEAVADKPCPRCEAQLRDPRIELYVETPNIGQFVRDSLYADPNLDEVSISEYLALTNIYVVISAMVTLAMNYVQDFGITFREFLVIALIIYLLCFVKPVIEYYIRYFRSGTHRMLRFTDYDGPGVDRIINVSQAQRIERLAADRQLQATGLQTAMLLAEEQAHLERHAPTTERRVNRMRRMQKLPQPLEPISRSTWDQFVRRMHNSSYESLGQQPIAQPYDLPPNWQPFAQPPNWVPPIGEPPPPDNIKEFQDILDVMPPEQFAQFAAWIIPPDDDEDEQDNEQG